MGKYSDMADKIDERNRAEAPARAKAAAEKQARLEAGVIEEDKAREAKRAKREAAAAAAAENPPQPVQQPRAPRRGSMTGQEARDFRKEILRN